VLAHLQKLEEDGLVEHDRDGRFVARMKETDGAPV
jgi:predicted ArsR family transcriptional regulator